MTELEIQSLINEQSTIILDREAKLSNTDYIAAKIAEGKATREEYADRIEERQQWRNNINTAQNRIAELEAITPEEDTNNEPIINE